MGNYLDLVKRAVVFGIAVVCALLNCAADSLVCIGALICSAGISCVVHNQVPFEMEFLNAERSTIYYHPRYAYYTKIIVDMHNLATCELVKR